jgi:hypothetical protein
MVTNLDVDLFKNIASSPLTLLHSRERQLLNHSLSPLNINLVDFIIDHHYVISYS